MRDLLDHVSASLKVHCPVTTNRRILVAASGGVDSQVLLQVLHRLAPSLSLEIAVAHAHHQLRGRASDADAALVEETARRLGWTFATERLGVKEAHAQTGESLEMAARRLRHDFLVRTAIELGISTVALAHHADDQAELVLLRLLRGSGGDGLGGMEWENPSPVCPVIRLIRPLLDVPRARLISVAREAAIPFREDRSNRDPRFLRNRVRHQLLPLLERRFSPAIRTLLVRTSDLVGTDAAFVAAEARRWRAAKRRTDYSDLPLALQRSVLREEVRALGHEPGFDLIERLRQHSGRPEELRPGFRILRTQEGRVLRQLPVSTSNLCLGESSYRIHPKGGRIEFEGRQVEYGFRRLLTRSRLRPLAGAEVFSARAVGNTIILRHWRTGDRFQPLGFPAEAGLKDLFIRRKVPQERRRHLLVATTNEGVLFWVETLPPGERFKVRGSTRRVLVWKFRFQT